MAEAFADIDTFREELRREPDEGVVLTLENKRWRS
jgi:hypothetical protein